MSTLYYLDTSAWVKRYALERGSEAIRAVIEGADGLSCSALGVVEAGAAIARRSRNTATAPEIEILLQELEADWAAFLQIRVSDAIVRAARNVAVAFGLRGADAIHLASLQGLIRRRPKGYDQVVLAAADQELLNAADLLGLPAWNPEDELQRP